MEKKLTPLMQQYWSIKKDHPDKILLFRMGDFFEMFDKDAEIAAPIVGITLTYRNKKSGDDTRMCGVPHHSISAPIAKLLGHGLKVAICDQIEDPKMAKGLVKRAVTRVLTPGLVYDPETLDETEAHYLASFDEMRTCFIDTTTGHAFYYKVTDPQERLNILRMLKPRELVVGSSQKSEAKSLQESIPDLYLSIFDPDSDDVECSCMDRTLNYLQKMQGEMGVFAQVRFEEKSLNRQLELPPTAVAHLEMFTASDGKREGSLFAAMNRTKTSAGARKLYQWMLAPLRSESEILKRQQKVENWMNQPLELNGLRKQLAALGDLERRITRLGMPSSQPQDIWSLAVALKDALQMASKYSELPQNFIERLSEWPNQVFTVFDGERIGLVKEGGFVRRGQSEELDYWIDLAENSKMMIQELEVRERNSTGISSLKLRYNQVFGFYIEVTKTHLQKIPDHYLRKQTLTNAERFTTAELQELEEKVLASRSRRIELEMQFFLNYKEQILTRHEEILKLASVLSSLDVESSLAWLALEQNYTKPTFTQDKRLKLVQSRHPVIEQLLDTPFVPNDIEMGPAECLLLTGPNMAGKSTLMRQVALTVILAQMGSFVPAKEAELPIFDRVLTRIGANDALSKGLSTFMVEMVETAEILKRADQGSLIVIDEIGRGTSTYDGMALAQSILEFLATSSQSLVFFATHFHELTELSNTYQKIKNGHMRISDVDGRLRFLHLFRSGPAERSYGIQVAGLAGVPEAVLERAKNLLSEFESVKGQVNDGLAAATRIEPNKIEQSEKKQRLLEELAKTSLNELTPLQVFNRVAKWQQELI